MNWTELLADLRAAGYTQTKLAKLLKTGQSTLSELSSGKTTNPSFELGNALVAIHTRVMSRPESRRQVAEWKA